MADPELDGVMWLIRSSVSMRKAHFMDKHPIRSTETMRNAHFMERNKIRNRKTMSKDHII